MNDLELTVIKGDGAAGQPTTRDVQLFDKAQDLLTADEHFQALGSPTLSRAEVNAGQQDTEPGYLYLRYDVPGSMPQEFWAHWGTRNKVAWESGQVMVKADG
jgi:hypothetical protein